MSGIRCERLDEALSGWDNGAGADMALWRREQVNKSTVSRTLKRGRERLRKYLQYCL